MHRTNAPAPTIRLHSLGCRLNEAELEEWAEQFRRAGIQLADDDQGADLVVINTCAVTQEAVRKSRKLLRRAQRDNPRARLIVSGCLAALEAEALAGESGVDLVVSNADKDRLVEIARATLTLPLMPESATAGGAEALFARGRQRAFVKVQDGCRYNCTFCITTRARGEERSRPIAQVVSVINRLTRQGVREVALTGVHLGGYGHDQGSDLGELIAAVLADTGIERLRLGSLEPWDLPEGFWELFADSRLMPHLHLPVQSGSDRVLRRMARRCKREAFIELVAAGRAARPELNVTTDVIVGFPGEDEEDWRETLSLVETVGFGHIHAFAYSPRAGTLAATLPGRVDTATKRARSQALQQLAAASRAQLLHEQRSARLEVLCEQPPDPARALPGQGYTPNYLPVRFTALPDPIDTNTLVEVEITGVDDDGEHLLGRAIRAR
ncbi:tRNA (N(6)-L-threonylcarbamoyladenosine(37)-C(2))-methylthiotransferase MtaB [Marichromatium gracile]|uniref:Threonylcarbamoyladenosine tRNA methylthiotransferase MtaB n=1 Tax=Marichromatium gracile TaxID=1048 RepID=A0A4R4ADG3_MARGR|nr:tRNA (N(6)-L-threonylcarbamoyladenosine(37)-C(2))-methylthiotransferase MtaB [Marichromatium gracile]MBK1709236.1 tRNA (N(6)-L-threonylcarbamoyladenosine(37)-C(2))-methylthiotransferase MtaB [Marichromatium gracile]TCW37132.1 threonylcarbamoyladenosine tRNA methylthiotransferase MtaB [Marichromatium gracile]